MVVLAELHPGRSIVRDDQRTRAEQSAKRNSGTDSQGGISLASLMGRAGEASKQEGEEEIESDGQYDNYDADEEDDDDDAEDRHFVESDKALTDLEEGMKALCGIDECRTHHADSKKIEEVITPQCCIPAEVIDLQKLIDVLAEVTKMEEEVVKTTCEKVPPAWEHAVRALETAKDGSPKEPWTGPPAGGAEGGGASAMPEAPPQAEPQMVDESAGIEDSGTGYDETYEDEVPKDGR